MRGEGGCKSMPKRKRINAYLATMKQETDEQAQPAIVVKESVSQEAQPIPEEQIQTPAQMQKGVEAKIERNENKKYHLKQVNVTIGAEREFKLDELAFTYTKKKKKRVNRNDIVRYLIDTISLGELLGVDLSQHEK
jgi:hypothetical protein